MWTLFLSSLLLLPLIRSTTEWWGDLRAHLNPPKSPAFYDVSYDETDCPQGLHSNAIPEYVYFGTMIATMSVDEHEDCLRKCIEKARCKAVNYFHPFGYQERGFCELLSETQRDNPRLMHPFRMATYFESIQCKDIDITDEIVNFSDKPTTKMSRKKKVEISSLMKKLSKSVKDIDSGFRAAR